VAGLTAAHELAERDFSVVVYENRKAPGGKARSMAKPGSATAGRLPLPGEHGFRFFPGFYRHVPDTMRRIPYGTRTVFDNLVPATEITVARAGAPRIILPAHLPTSPAQIGLVLKALFRSHLGLSWSDALHITERLLMLLASSTERRLEDFEPQSWWDFSGAAQRSPAYQKFLADGLTRTLVAAKAKEMSARTGGLILLQLLFDLARVGSKMDRILCGPTSDVWLGPWVDYLTKQKGVEIHYDSRATSIHCAGHDITGITVRTPASTKVESKVDLVTADYYVVAVPVEIMRDALVNDDLRKAEPRLADLHQLKTRWMNGVMFYLRTDVPLRHGHTIYIDSEWALTSISQHQFWSDVDFSRLGDGQVRGILSVDVSDWETDSSVLKKPAKRCSRDELVGEVWRQLKVHCNDGDLPVLDDANLVTTFVDPDVEWPNPDGVTTNAEPLLINTAGSWRWRPDAVTAVGNLFLAGDYVRTNTDLATMEGANEAARRAVNGILDAHGSNEPRCQVWALDEPMLTAPLRAVDRAWFEVRPHFHGVGA